MQIFKKKIFLENATLFHVIPFRKIMGFVKVSFHRLFFNFVIFYFLKIKKKIRNIRGNL